MPRRRGVLGGRWPRLNAVLNGVPSCRECLVLRLLTATELECTHDLLPAFRLGGTHGGYGTRPLHRRWRPTPIDTGHFPHRAPPPVPFTTIYCGPGTLSLAQADPGPSLTAQEAPTRRYRSRVPPAAQ